MYITNYMCLIVIVKAIIFKLVKEFVCEKRAAEKSVGVYITGVHLVYT